MPANKEIILSLKDVTKKFGGLTAVDNLSFDVPANDIIGIIGPNGAGKTTVFNLISGITPLTAGEIFFSNKKINEMQPSKIARAGIARTFQEIHLFKGVTVLENVKAAGYITVRYNLAEALLRLSKATRKEKELEEKTIALLEKFDLFKHVDSMAEELPYGLQKRLEIVKALITEPALILLDEPAAGLNNEETYQLMELIQQIRNEFELTVLVIEHTMDVIQGVCDYIYVINFGEKIAQGSWEEVNSNEEVISCYLGEE